MLMRRFWKTVLLLGGLALFAWYLSRADLRAVGDAIRRLGWLAPIILLPYFMVYVVDWVAWRWCFPPRLSLPFFTLFRIRWAGEAVNNVLPSGTVGGEAVKLGPGRDPPAATEPSRSGTAPCEAPGF